MLREEADADPEEHFGSHLAILWEDPYRLTPFGNKQVASSECSNVSTYCYILSQKTI